VRRFAPVVLLTAALAPAQDYRVRAPAPRPGTIAPVVARVDAAQDAWVGEQDYEALNAYFKDVSGSIKQGRSPIAALAPTVSRFSRIQVAELKIVASNRATSSETETTLRLRVELAGILKSGRRASFLTTAEARFSLSPAGPALQSFVPAPWRSTELAAPLFHNVSAAALGRNPAFAAQLNVPLDTWRQRIDPALGPSVYGHNGVAVADIDGDGFEDLFVAQPNGLPNRLFHNNGDGTFTDITRRAGLAVLDDTSMGLFADIDNDGDQDLIAITAEIPHLFRNDGRGRFTRSPTPGFRPTSGTLTSAALADYDGDGRIDLYVCSYGFFSPGASYDAPTPYYDATNGPANFLYRNLGNGRFQDVTAATGLNENNNRFSFAAAWADFDRDGHIDLYVANDFGRNNLYRNDGRGRFHDVAAAMGVDDLAAGMSAAWADIDNDGFPDLYSGNMWSSAGLRLTHNPAFASVARDPAIRAAFQRQARGNSLFRNNPGRAFADATFDAGVEFGRWAWSSDFLDFDNDGNLDLYVQNGYVAGPDTHDL
jgi:hypothetical protein